MFLSDYARYNIQVTLAFITRVKKPDVDGWRKLQRVLKYLKDTKYMKLILSIDNMSKILWWVDTSDQTHADCKGHTGTTISLDEGAVIRSSRKQKNNTKNFTDLKLVALDDTLATIYGLSILLRPRDVLSSMTLSLKTICLQLT